MRRRLVLSLAVLALAATAALASASGAGNARITVRPATGSPTTSFVVSFRAPGQTGRFGNSERRFVLSAAGPLGTKGCLANVDTQLPYSRAHALRRVTLDATGVGSRWCPGTFHGGIEEIQSPVCPRGKACPAFVLLLGTIGRFTFHVNATAGDTTPPTFAGLQSAMACTPGAQRPGQTTPFNLRWNAATDDVTPTPQIVYDIFMSTTSGAEDFSKPTWTTPAGALTYRTPDLPSHGALYFVVRARDQAGNEDRNKIERQGLDPCL